MGLAVIIGSDLEKSAARQAVNPRKFFSELKRRNVYKVAIAYAVVAWLLMQIATQVFPFLEIPNWAIRLVIMLIVIGFPCCGHSRGDLGEFVFSRALYRAKQTGLASRAAGKVSRCASVR